MQCSELVCAISACLTFCCTQHPQHPQHRRGILLILPPPKSNPKPKSRPTPRQPLLLFPLLALVLLGDELLRHLEADTAAAAAAGAGAAAAAGAAGAGTGAAAAAGAAGAGSGRVGPRGPLSRLYGEVAAAHPGCTLLVYVVGLQEAMSRRQRANKVRGRRGVGAGGRGL